jgi:hypothetical protein
MICALKALPVLTFPTSGRTPTRTGDLIDVNDEKNFLHTLSGKYFRVPGNYIVGETVGLKL